MSVARAKGNRGLCDVLFSRIVRSRGRCQYPGCNSDGPYDTAHLVGRTYSATRCHEDNALCMCRTHHQAIDAHWHEKQKACRRTIGEDRYHDLYALAQQGHGTTATLFWADEVSRLKVRCADLGLSDKRAS